MAVIFVAELTVKLEALIIPNLTAVAPVNPVLTVKLGVAVNVGMGVDVAGTSVGVAVRGFKNDSPARPPCFMANAATRTARPKIHTRTTSPIGIHMVRFHKVFLTGIGSDTGGWILLAPAPGSGGMGGLEAMTVLGDANKVESAGF